MTNNDSLVAINLTSKNSLLNPSDVPVLFYWDGEGDLNEAITGSPEFQHLVETKCFDADNYTSSKVSYFYFMFVDDNEEAYTEKNLTVQDVFLLRNMTPEQSSFIYSYLLRHFGNLYRNAYNEDLQNQWTNNDEFIKEVFNKIQELYPDKFSLETCLNYIRQKAKKTEGLNDNNADFVVEKTRQILTKVEV